MWKQYIKTAWRGLLKNKLFGILNIGGLAIGIAICIPLFIYVSHELSFDNAYKNKESIFRINLTAKASYGVAPTDENWSTIPNAVGPTALKDVPQIKYAARFFLDGFGEPSNLRIGQRNYTETGLYWSDPSILNIFPAPFVKGDSAKALSNPNSVIIAVSEAKRLFGDDEAMGKTIHVSSSTGGTSHLLVTGVFQDYPGNSSFQGKMIAPIASTWASHLRWQNASFETYCLLNNNADPEVAEQALNKMVVNNVDSADRWYSLFLQPLSEVHLYSSSIKNVFDDAAKTDTIHNIRNIGLLGLVIILIACINYMNLSTARSEKYAKEVAVNKTMGATSIQMVKRFYAETALMVLAAIVVGYLLSFGSIDLFNYVTEKHLPVSALFSFNVLLALACIWLVVTLVAGSYPAFMLSSFSPMTLMGKGSGKSSFELLFRRALVVLQFSCSVILIITVIVIARQMKFVSQKNLGFAPSSVLAINISGIQEQKEFDALQHSLKNIPAVKEITVVQNVPGRMTSLNSLEQRDNPRNIIALNTCNAQHGVVSTLGLKFLAGKDLPEKIHENDSACYLVVNKKVIDFYGWTPDEAIGKKVYGWQNNTFIIGVVADFNYTSLHQPVGAYLYYESNSGGEPYNDVLVKFSTSHFSQTMQQIEKAYKKNVPMTAFDYQLLDNVIDQLYRADRVTSRISLLFSVLAIFVSCLGLFGLTAYSAEKRKKEIGIRKVLGATIFNITSLLSKDFLKLVLVSIVIAVPVSVLLMNKWLNNFAYRINISWVAIAIAAATAVIIAYITVSAQAIKAAKANPVDSLKTE